MENEKTVVERLDELPFIPEQIRFFAYDYAPRGKDKSLAEWAKKYDVKVSTIEKWLKHPGVRQYIEIICTEAKKGHLQEMKDRLKEVRERSKAKT